MTLVTGTVQDLGYDGMEGTLWARPARFRSDGQVVYAPERKPFKITGGVVSAELAPGPAVLELQVGSHARGTFEVVIPDTDIGLADLMDTVFAWEPAQVSLFVAEREAAELAKAEAEAAAQQTGQDRSHVDQVRTELEEAYDASQAGQALPPRLTEAALNATYRTRRTAIFDSFEDVQDGALPVLAESGQPWGFSYEGSRTEVRNGRLRPIIPGDYPELRSDRPIKRIGARFVINDHEGTRTGNTGLLSLNLWHKSNNSTVPGARSSAGHVYVTQQGYHSYSVRGYGESDLLPIPTKNLAHPLVAGVEYTFEYFIQGDTAYVLTPDGAAHTMTHPLIAEVECFYANWQMLSADDNAAVFELLEVWADDAPSGFATQVHPAVVELVAKATERREVGAAQKASPSITVTTESTVIEGTEVVAKAGPNGYIVWDIEVPLDQSGGDGGVGSGSVWFAVTGYNDGPSGKQLVSRTSRATWATTNGVARRRILEGGFAPGQSVTRSVAIYKDSGSGTTVVSSQRAVLITGTPA